MTKIQLQSSNTVAYVGFTVTEKKIQLFKYLFHCFQGTNYIMLGMTSLNEPSSGCNTQLMQIACRRQE